MRGILAAILLVMLLAGVEAQPSTGAAPVSVGASPTLARSPRLVTLIHHTLDQVDPFGVPFGSGDTFSARYADIAAQTGRFDFPVFVADGVTAIQQLPDPMRPFEGTLEAYRQATADRLKLDTPGTMGLSASIRDGRAVATVRADTTGWQPDPQGQQVHLWLAVVEDGIHYKPPAPVSNGVTDHRFTVRGIVDAGPADLKAEGVWNRTVSIPVGADWQRDRLTVAAWLQAGRSPGRFQPNEVVQVISTFPDGVERFQTGKGVLVEAYSATWCDECLYGDLALEQLAIEAGAAQPLEPAAATYWTAPQQPILVASVALAAFALAVFLARRRA